MPLWTIYHPSTTFNTTASKSAFSLSITNLYTTKIKLPAFYVVVQFIKLPDGDVWIGGIVPNNNIKPFIRIVIDHTAVNMPAESEDAAYKQTCLWVDEAMRRHIADKGYEWEYHINENDRRFWKINGLVSKIKKIFYHAVSPTNFPSCSRSRRHGRVRRSRSGSRRTKPCLGLVTIEYENDTCNICVTFSVLRVINKTPEDCLLFKAVHVSLFDCLRFTTRLTVFI
jgi:hypothetical protein